MKLKVLKETDENSGLITMSIEGTSFGPVVSGFNEEEVIAKFEKAMGAALIFKTFMSINNMISQKQFDEGIIKNSVEENKNFQYGHC